MGPVCSHQQSSLFYEACSTGNLEVVQKMLPDLTLEEINQIDSINGNTALHAACQGNHIEIIRLLLPYSLRTIVNRQGKTALEMMSITDELHTLFSRQGTSERFVDSSSSIESFLLKAADGSELNETSHIPDNWQKGYLSASDANESQFMFAIARAPRLLKAFIKQRTERECCEEFRSLLNEIINQEDKQVFNLYDNFLDKGRIDSLLTLYTLETPLYSVLQNNANAFTALLFLHLPELFDRAYQGETYRGISMTLTDIDAYKWAVQRQDFVLETRTLQSTSKKKTVAQGFAGAYDSSRLSVLITFHFPHKCSTAINLTRVNDKLPPLSNFADEEEVLLLPFTLFQVRSINIDSHTGKYEIILYNIPKIQQLDVERIEITDAMAQLLADVMKNNTTITGLYIMENQISEKGLGCIVNVLRKNKTLTSLGIDSNELGSGAMRLLTPIVRFNETITDLSISYNQIDDLGAFYLADALAYNTTLTSLDLRYNIIEDEGAKNLLKALKCNTTLTTIHLGNNWISKKIEERMYKCVQRNEERSKSSKRRH
ncbi:hypothetical protein I4U23_003918 [Adineta vaga]|nr:hypothetical protein I4U23_003918 [Adineta vaga]